MHDDPTSRSLHSRSSVVVTPAGGRSEVVVAPDVRVVAVLVRLLQLREVDLVAQDAAHATEAAAELAALLALVGDELERAAKLLVVVGQPLQQRQLLLHLQVGARLGVLEVARVLGLLAGQVLHLRLATGGVEQLVAVAVQRLPHDQRLHCSHVQAHQRVLHAKHVLARVLRDLLKELGDEALLLHKLDVGQHVGRQLDGLVEAVVAAVADVHHAQDHRLQAQVKHV
mmetsp:Transcript_34697/g.87798  ORF Transcript_34697/g.87798 Transcript_34697/m.87798 type:complete len:227 (+) Transcript_34697:109-789(+)